MGQKTILLVILGLFTMGHMALKVVSSYSEEACGYGGEAPSYTEEAPGYGEEDEGSALFIPSAGAPVAVSTNQPPSLDELIMWYDSSSC